MEKGPTATIFDLGDDFFAQLNLEAQELNLAAVAGEALAGILTIETESGDRRSYEQIKQETEVFFANPLVIQNMELLSSLSAQYADFCAGHGLDASSGINDGALGSVFGRGNSRHGVDDGHGHATDAHQHKGKTRTKSKKTKESKKQRLPTTWAALLAKYSLRKTVSKA
jgi:hypothetical protein